MIYALVVGRFAIAALVLPALGLVAFYALLSHFISRYAVPLAPVVVVSAIISLNILWHTYFDRRRLANAPPRSKFAER